jgi:hypothetical protein
MIEAVSVGLPRGELIELIEGVRRAVTDWRDVVKRLAEELGTGASSTLGAES